MTKIIGVKFLDDATAACSINLKNSLIQDPQERPQPHSYFEKDKLILPIGNNPLKEILEEISLFTDNQKMKINEGKTKIMMFNKSNKLQFPPEIGFTAQKNLEYVSQAKILGIIITDDLKWSENTDFITKKAMSRLWTLRRMKNLGISKDIIYDVYIKEIRSILEFGVPVWNGGISLHDSDRIEIIQKRAFKIILQDQYYSYDNACVVFSTQSLKERRITICLNFAKKELSKEDSIFSKFVQSKVTRLSGKQLVNERFCNTERHYRSSLPYLSRLINSTNKDTHTQIH